MLFEKNCTIQIRTKQGLTVILNLFQYQGQVCKSILIDLFNHHFTLIFAEIFNLTQNIRFYAGTVFDL